MVTLITFRWPQTWLLFKPVSPPWWDGPSQWTSWDRMLAPWWRELQKLSLPSEIFVSQCKNMSVLRWLPCSLMQKVIVRTPLSMKPHSNSLIYSGNVQDRELEQIHSRYMNCLRTFIEYNYPQEPNRVQELLVKLPEVRSWSGPKPSDFN